MARQSRTIKASARMGGSKSAQALSRLGRVSNVVREIVRMVRAGASIARSGDYRWQVPGRDSLWKDKQVFETGFCFRRTTARDGSGRGSGGERGWSETGDRTKTESGGSGRATAMVNAVARVSREVPKLSRAMNALSRVERSIELGKTVAATSDALKYATPMLASNTDAKSRARAGHETRRPSFADAGVLANVRVVPSIRGVMPPQSVSRRDFARPSSDVGISNDRSGRAAITINSSPTVVINAPAGGALQHDVIGALQAHREELFDQLKRESARRERAQF